MKRLLHSSILIACFSGPVLAQGLIFATPDGWRVVASSSTMRTAQYVLPRAEGDSQDAELTVYYFGGAGGTVDANIERWLGQMQQPDGKPSSIVARRQKRSVSGLTLSLVDVSGTYVAEMTPGSTPRHHSANFRLRAAVVETPSGPYFIKLTGPENTIAGWDKAYEQFLASVKYQP